MEAVRVAFEEAAGRFGWTRYSSLAAFQAAREALAAASSPHGPRKNQAEAEARALCGLAEAAAQPFAANRSPPGASAAEDDEDDEAPVVAPRYGQRPRMQIIGSSSASDADEGEEQPLWRTSAVDRPHPHGAAPVVHAGFDSTASEAEEENHVRTSPEPSSEGSGISIRAGSPGARGSDEADGSDLDRDLSGFIVSDSEGEDAPSPKVPTTRGRGAPSRGQRGPPLRQTVESTDDDDDDDEEDEEVEAEGTGKANPLPPSRWPLAEANRGPARSGQPLSKKQFAGQRDAMARQLYQRFNTEAFGDQLPTELELRWSKTLNTTAGRAILQRNPRTAEYFASIELSTKVGGQGARSGLPTCSG